MKTFLELLSGGDLRSIGKSNDAVTLIKCQDDFDVLFGFLFDKDRKVVMRAADALEKVTLNNHQYLQKHKTRLIQLCFKAVDKELKWHLALLASRLKLTKDELESVRELLTRWALNKDESKIVRVNSIQAMFEILRLDENCEEEFKRILFSLEKQNIPSINARIRKLRKVHYKK